MFLKRVFEDWFWKRFQADPWFLGLVSVEEQLVVPSFTISKNLLQLQCHKEFKQWLQIQNQEAKRVSKIVTLDDRKR